MLISIDLNIVHDMPQLTCLNFAGNKIRIMNIDSLRNIGHHVVIDVSNNSITAISGKDGYETTTNDVADVITDNGFLCCLSSIFRCSQFTPLNLCTKFPVARESMGSLIMALIIIIQNAVCYFMQRSKVKVRSGSILFAVIMLCNVTMGIAIIACACTEFLFNPYQIHIKNSYKHIWCIGSGIYQSYSLISTVLLSALNSFCSHIAVSKLVKETPELFHKICMVLTFLLGCSALLTIAPLLAFHLEHGVLPNVTRSCSIISSDSDVSTLSLGLKLFGLVAMMVASLIPVYCNIRMLITIRSSKQRVEDFGDHATGPQRNCNIIGIRKSYIMPLILQPVIMCLCNLLSGALAICIVIGVIDMAWEDTLNTYYIPLPCLVQATMRNVRLFRWPFCRRITTHQHAA